jgi:hypothetical protein
MKNQGKLRIYVTNVIKRVEKNIENNDLLVVKL